MASMCEPHRQTRSKTGSELKILLRWLSIAVFVLFLISGYMTTPWLSGIQNMLKAFCEQQTTLSMVLTGIVYTLLLAIPFIPAVELGLLIMILFGKAGCVFAYFCTVAGLSLSYSIGWFVCRYNVTKVQSFDKENLGIQNMMDKLSHTRSGSLLQVFCSPLLLRFRYLSIAMLVNIPGNSLIGGGGGISMFCGASSHIRYLKFLITVAIATSLFPVLMLSGIQLAT